jgi:hypothetical protein
LHCSLRCFVSTAFCVSLLVVAGMLLAGCGQQQQRQHAVEPATVEVSTNEEFTSEPFSIEPYLGANRLGRWTYSRTASGDPEDTYVRLSSATRMLEGRLIDRDFLPLQNYVEQPGATDRQARRQRPRAPLEGGTGFLFELTEPLEVVPDSLVPGAPLTASTPLVYYQNDGRVLSRGTLTRTVHIEGFEEVQVPAGRFADCMRVRLDLALQIPWMITMNWTSEMWLSPEMGEVRRTEQMSGWVLVFPFSSTHEYRLISGESFSASPEPQAVRPPLWRYGAVLMDRTVPRPRIGGMVVDYSDLPPSPAPETLTLGAPAAKTPMPPSAAPPAEPGAGPLFGLDPTTE